MSDYPTRSDSLLPDLSNACKDLVNDDTVTFESYPKIYDCAESLMATWDYGSNEQRLEWKLLLAEGSESIEGSDRSVEQELVRLLEENQENQKVQSALVLAKKFIDAVKEEEKGEKEEEDEDEEGDEDEDEEQEANQPTESKEE